MSELDPRLERRLGALRRLPEPRPEAVSRLRAALRGRSRQPGARITLTPLTAAAAVVLVAVATSMGWWLAGGSGAGPGPAGATPVQFVLHAPSARAVTVVGDFNDWDADATPLAESGSGVWSAVVPLTPGPVRYSFLVDGREWRADPNAATVRSDFGRPTSVVLVGPATLET